MTDRIDPQMLVADLPFSWRIRRVLMGEGLRYVHQVAAIPNLKLERIQHFGPKTVAEIRAVIPFDATASAS